MHPLLLTLPSLTLNVGAPHASEAEALPSAPLISPADGLQPRLVLVPPVVIVGPVWSSVQLIA
jgi:hypothetical protein